jgi:hypothetical protein
MAKADTARTQVIARIGSLAQLVAAPWRSLPGDG